MNKKFTFLLFFVSFYLFSQNPILSEGSKISVLTCGSGEELYTTFGHTAVRIQDKLLNIDLVYNYGMFDFTEGNFYAKFVKGDLQYFEAANNFEDFMYEYKIENRKVTEQILNLDLTQKQKLFESLNLNLFTKEKFYTYKFIDKNCTTMVLDKLNAVLKENKIEKNDDKTISYREVLNPYFENFFWYKLGISIVFGEKVDRKATKLFLPIELENSLDVAKNGNANLVLNKQEIVKGIPIQSKFNFFDSIYVIISILLILALLYLKFLNTLFFTLMGIVGLFFVLVGFYSWHEELLWNYNALLFNPLFLLLPFIKKKELLKKTILVLGFCLVVYTLLMLNKPHLILVLPFMIFSAYYLFKLWEKTSLLSAIKNQRT